MAWVFDSWGGGPGQSGRVFFIPGGAGGYYLSGYAIGDGVNTPLGGNPKADGSNVMPATYRWSGAGAPPGDVYGVQSAGGGNSGRSDLS